MKKHSKNRSSKVHVLINPVNNELWNCDDLLSVKNIDGVDYITVYKPENPKRTFLFRKEALKILNKSFNF